MRAAILAGGRGTRLAPYTTVLPKPLLPLGDRPILEMILFSFNDPPGRFNFVWGEFSTAAWANPFGRPGLQDAIVTSLAVAFVSIVMGVPGRQMLRHPSSSSTLTRCVLAVVPREGA